MSAPRPGRLRELTRRVRVRLARMFRMPRRLRFVRDGKYFVAITIAIGLGAINTGNNLLYLLLGWMFSVIIASGILSELSLRDLEVTRILPARAFAGQAFLTGIALANRKARASSFSTEIEDLVDGEPLEKRCYFLKVPPGQTQSTSYRHTFERRGSYRFEGLRIATRFPFSLFRKSRDLDLADELVVFPAVHAVTPPAPSPQESGEESRARAGRHGEFFGLREWREGDDPRDVHWPTSARHVTGMLVVREREDESRRRVTLLLDNALLADATLSDHDALERAISLAASLAIHYTRLSYTLRLVCRGVAVPDGSGEAHLERLLRTLALLASTPESTPFAGHGEPGHGAAGGGETLLVVRRGHAGPRPAGVTAVLEA